MTTAASIPPQTLPREHYLNATYGIRSWLLTTDHKRIALFYLASVKFFFILGSIFAFIIRLNLLTPQGNLVSSIPALSPRAP
jgi:cytochrome c oxidase subunit I